MKRENYSIIELLHLSFIVRDSLEYCHEPLPLKENAFESRSKMIKQLLEENHFIAKFLVENPSESGKQFYDALNKYFENIYDKEENLANCRHQFFVRMHSGSGCSWRCFWHEPHKRTCKPRNRRRAR